MKYEIVHTTYCFESKTFERSFDQATKVTGGSLQRVRLTLSETQRSPSSSSLARFPTSRNTAYASTSSMKFRGIAPSVPGVPLSPPLFRPRSGPSPRARRRPRHGVGARVTAGELSVGGFPRGHHHLGGGQPSREELHRYLQILLGPPVVLDDALPAVERWAPDTLRADLNKRITDDVRPV